MLRCRNPSYQPTSPITFENFHNKERRHPTNMLNISGNAGAVHTDTAMGDLQAYFLSLVQKMEDMEHTVGVERGGLRRRTNLR
jgi:hypothetical protein